MSFRVDAGGGLPVRELRLCSCGRVGDVSECGPHRYSNIIRRYELTVRHPDDAAQSAYLIGGLQAACEYLKELSIKPATVKLIEPPREVVHLFTMGAGRQK